MIISVELPDWKRILFVICGYETPKEPMGELSEEEKKEQRRLLTSIKEDPKWKWFVNINAMLLMAFGIFLWGFYA